MYTHPQQGVPQEDVLRLRQAAGAYIKQRREAAGLSQRNLAKAVNIEHYTFISQIESGRGRVPPAQMGDWARALNVPVREFAINMLRYYDPITYDLIFTDDLVAMINADQSQAREPAADTKTLEARIAKLESLIARF